MTNNEILERLSSIKNGAYLKVTKEKDLGQNIKKISILKLRKGVKTNNMSIYKDKQAGSLPWGNWVEGLENLVIKYKGNYYLRFVSTDPENIGSGRDIISTQYLLNDVVVSKDKVISILGEKKIKSKGSPIYNIKFENILAID